MDNGPCSSSSGEHLGALRSSITSVFHSLRSYPYAMGCRAVCWPLTGATIAVMRRFFWGISKPEARYKEGMMGRLAVVSIVLLVVFLVFGSGNISPTQAAEP